METRDLSPTDADAVAELWLAGAQESAIVDSALQPGVSLAQHSALLTQKLDSRAVIGWGAFSAESKLQGYLTARIAEAEPVFVKDTYLYLLDLDVRADARRQGIASALVRMARSFAANNGISSIEVNWLIHDGTASVFWSNQGFSQYLARARVVVPKQRRDA